MMDYPEFLLRLSVVWAALIAYHWIALRRAPFRTQRIYLLFATFAGLVIPTLPTISGSAVLPILVPIQEAFSFTVVAGENLITANPQSIMPSFWVIAYASGVLFLLALSLVQWWGRRRWNATGDQASHEGYQLTIHPDIPSPFTLFGRIYLPQRLVGTSLGDTALLHETSHLRQRHHYDALQMQMLCTLLWFHPLSWILRKLLSDVHEYEADAQVIKTIPRNAYGLQLLRASQTSGFALGLFSSPLKNRINMLTNSSPRRNRLELAILPLLLGLLTFTCSDVIAQDAPIKAVAVSAAGVPHLASLPEDATDEEALRAFMKAVYSEIRYPQSARNSGVEARIYLSMSVSPDGKVRQFEVTDRGNGPSFGGDNIVVIGYGDKGAGDAGERNSESLIAEVRRMVSYLNQQGGFKYEDSGYADVPVTYGISFRFKLEPEEDE
ncbi:M56 family metallopeptidase [Lewinella sp. 4G2]|uniref:M56 family metallopeptidase n=1 Tax=Lewinella sp. 4G2 TaxID=1803372 RepID=UPI0007B4E1B6|nr:M56 family metallopeptidase [Lewinella sp. 4G2]OAV42889.1 hypothetical protein A3850_016835 [Lewinella sp. 4G2]